MIDRAPHNTSVHTGPATPGAPPGVARRTRVLLMLLTAGIVSAAAGMLAHAADNNVPSAILTGGGAFAGTVGLLLAIALYTGAE
jgi:hypothetical protein